MSSRYFCVSSYRLRDIKMLHLYLQKVGHGHRVQFSQLHHSMANVKIFKCPCTHFYASSYRFRYMKIFYLFTSTKQVKVKEYNFRNYTIRQQMSKSTNVSHTFLLQLLQFQIYKKINKCLPSKSRSRSRRAILTIVPFDDKCQIFKRHFYIFYFSYGVTYAHDFNRQTRRHTHTQTETDKLLAIVESCRFALKPKTQISTF